MKHQPCGKPGCLNCLPLISGNPAQGPAINMQAPLTENERFELNAYRAKAKLESDAYLNLARSMQHDDRVWPRDNGSRMAEMQRAQNVNLHARELPGKEFVRANNADRPSLLHATCKIASRILVVALVVGAAMAVVA